VIATGNRCSHLNSLFYLYKIFRPIVDFADDGELRPFDANGNDDLENTFDTAGIKVMSNLREIDSNKTRSHMDKPEEETRIPREIFQ
jgi:hypothetical protein